MTVRGDELVAGQKVRWAGDPEHRVWTVLPLRDPIGWLGEPDGGLVPIVPDDPYDLLEEPS